MCFVWFLLFFSLYPPVLSLRYPHRFFHTLVGGLLDIFCFRFGITRALQGKERWKDREDGEEIADDGGDANG